jgi:hypothetical protein
MSVGFENRGRRPSATRLTSIVFGVVRYGMPEMDKHQEFLYEYRRTG